MGHNIIGSCRLLGVQKKL